MLPAIAIVGGNIPVAAGMALAFKMKKIDQVVAASNAYDAKGMLKSAIRDDNPVIMFDHKLLYGSKGARAETGAIDSSSDIPDEDYTVPLDKAAICREGSDCTILS